ncbi:DNA translocase FtsK, partial [bacterium]|nr:DNA translocase FtsK [bacterium]
MASIDRPFASQFPAGRFGGPRPGFSSVEAAALRPEADRDRLRDIAALVLLAGSLFLTAALATYDPADPPTARAFPPHAQPLNACGRIGAVAAATLYEWLGIGAWFVVALVVGVDLALLRRRALPDLPVRAAGAVMATLGLCTLLAMFVPAWCPRPVWGPGGSIGALGRTLAETHLARAGAAILATAAAAAGLFLACDAALVSLGAACLSGAAAIAGALRSGSGALRSRLVRDRMPGLDETTATTVADGFPALRLRGLDRVTEGDEEDEIEDAGPTIKVRRREIERDIDAEDDSSFDDDSDAFDVDADAADGGDSSSADEESADPPVPIRSRGNRRKPASVLELALDPTAEYELPSIDLLLPAEQMQLDAQEQEVRERAKVLEKTFADFGFKVKVVEVETGPVISQYEIELEAGLRLAKIANLADDLAIALRVPSVRIVAPIPGKNSVGIEVPNTDRQMVRLREVIEETQAKSRTMKIPIFLGKDVAGN